MPATPYITSEEDALLGFCFRLELEGVLSGFFTECNGIGSENDVAEHKIVDENGKEIVRKVPGRLKWTDVTLKRGITSNMDIWEWRDRVVLGQMGDARKNVSIQMCDREGTPVATWHLNNCWPSKVTGPSMKADSNEVGVEEVVLVHEGMYREV